MEKKIQSVSASLMGKTLIWKRFRVRKYLVFRCNKSKALAMGAGHVKNAGNALFIILSLFFLMQFK